MTNNVHKLVMNDRSSEIFVIRVAPARAAAQQQGATWKLFKSLFCAFSTTTAKLTCADPLLTFQNSIVCNGGYIQQKTRRLSRKQLHELLMENHKRAMAHRMSDLQRDFHDIYVGLMDD